MKEQIMDILKKILLTIPALIIGMIGAAILILKPTIILWSKKEDVTE